jgi:hypothetical protein
MLKIEIARGKHGRIVLMDSITKLVDEDENAIVVSASHGGASSGEFALQIPLAAVFFNDAGVGKDKAGIVALDMLERHAIPAGAVAHTDARIGDARDMWDNGIISYVNNSALKVGWRPGLKLQQALTNSIETGYPRVTRDESKQ